MDELLQIATKENFCEANFCEHQSFISFNFTNKLQLPTWIFDNNFYLLKALGYKNLMCGKAFNWAIYVFQWKKWLLEKERKTS